MFRTSFNNYNQIPMWRNGDMGFKAPMMPLTDFDNNKNTRQGPMLTTSTTDEQPQDTSQNVVIPPTVSIIDNPLYNQGWLKRQIGKYIKVDFLLGTSTFQDRVGILQDVGISFIVLKDVNTNDLTMCDIYSIKFVTVYSDQTTCIH